MQKSNLIADSETRLTKYKTLIKTTLNEQSHLYILVKIEHKTFLYYGLCFPKKIVNKLILVWNLIQVDWVDFSMSWKLLVACSELKLSRDFVVLSLILDKSLEHL